MKKLSFLIIVFMLLTVRLNASCSYSERKDYNILSSYIETNYDFNESSKTFNVTYYNIENNIALEYNNNIFYPSNKEVTIYGVSEGASLNVSAIVISGECEGVNLRTIRTNLPYLNKYYGSRECEGHEELNVCSSKFLAYQLSGAQFDNLINKSNEDKFNFETEEDELKENEKDTSFKSQVIIVLKKVYIPALLVIGSSIITLLIFRSIYRKVNHGL